MAAPQIPLFTGITPSRDQEPQAFSNNINDWVAYQPSQVTGTNTVSTFVNTQATAAETSANIAGTAITSANFKGAWSNLTGAIPDPATDATTVSHNSKFYQALNAIVDVTLSEPGVSADWVLSAQTASRVIITPPLTLEISGRYYINGAGTITLPLPTALPDGTSFTFARSPSIEPIVFVGTNLVTTESGLTDGIIMDIKQIEMTIINSLYEV